MKKISKEPAGRYLYAFEFPFDMGTISTCRMIKEKYGSKSFAFELGKWRFNNLDLINVIKERYPETIIMANMQDDMERFEAMKQSEKIREQRAEELRRAETTDFKIKNIKEEPYPYQRIGVEFFVNSLGRTILGDEPGVGKTCQAVCYLAHMGLEKSLVVCPASVKYVWENETIRWTKLKPYVISGKTKLTMDIINDHNVFIINYDILKKFKDFLTNVRIECMVLDEFHMVKNSSAKRTQLVKQMAAKIPSLLFLSGTPILNRPVELFNALSMLDPATWNDWFGFTKRYCEGKLGRFGWEYKGASNIEELQQRIGKYFLRRTKRDVLKFLPPKVRIDIPVELNPDIYKNYKLAEESFVSYLQDIKKKKPEEITPDINTLKLIKLNELRQLCSAGKVESAKEIIDNIIDSGDKIIVFSTYNATLEKLQEYYGDVAVMITGKTDVKERGDIVNKFQNDGKIRVFLGGMLSAGVGITLTAASTVLFVDYDWVPANHLQAQDRLHRPGQEAEKVFIYQLYARGTIDAYMQKILQKKREIIDKLIDGSISLEANQSIVNDLVKLLENGA